MKPPIYKTKYYKLLDLLEEEIGEEKTDKLMDKAEKQAEKLRNL